MRPQACPSYGKLCDFQSEVSGRQLLDAELAMDLAPGLGCRWLVCLDSDELFCTEKPSVVPHFEELEEKDVYQMSYLNHAPWPKSHATHCHCSCICSCICSCLLNKLSLSRFDSSRVFLSQFEKSARNGATARQVPGKRSLGRNCYSKVSPFWFGFARRLRRKGCRSRWILWTTLPP